MSATTAYQQARRVKTNAFAAEMDGTIDDLYIDAEVTHSKDSGLSAEISVWNIKRERWQSLSKGDPFTVSLGYHDGPFEPVIFGTVNEKSPPERDDNGTKYTFRGPDEGTKLLKSNSWSHTWQSPPVEQVVRDIANEAGIGIETIKTSGATINRRYPISKKHSLYHWLNKLKNFTDEATGTQHRHYCTAGKLSFVPKSEVYQQAVALRDGKQGNVMKIDPAEGKGKKTEGSDNLEIKMLLDPRVRKDGLARVETEDYWGTYKFGEYTMSSATSDGTHMVEATLVPSDAGYRKLIDSEQRKLLAGY